MALYPILDTQLLARHGIALREAVALALSFPLPYVQIRHKGDFDRAFVAELEACAAQPHQGRLILNDRADYACLFGLGLHVGQDDLPVVEARRIVGPEAALGLSTHNLPQIQASPSAALTYLAIGPIFGTQSKANPDPVVGLEALQAWRGATPLPVVAIGGITLENAGAVLEAGADFLALISALWRAPYTLDGFGLEIETWLKKLPPSKRGSASSTRPPS